MPCLNLSSLVTQLRTATSVKEIHTLTKLALGQGLFHTDWIEVALSQLSKHVILARSHSHSKVHNSYLNSNAHSSSTPTSASKEIHQLLQSCFIDRPLLPTLPILRTSVQFYLHTQPQPTLAVIFYNLFKRYPDLYPKHQVLLYVLAFEMFTQLSSKHQNQTSLLLEELKYALANVPSKQAKTTLYSSSIVSFCKLKNLDMAMDVFFQMQSNHLIPNVKAMSSLLQLLLQRNHMQHLKLFTSYISTLIQSDQFKPDPLLCNLMLKVYAKSDIEKALHFFQTSMPFKDANAYSILVEACFEKKLFHQAKLFFMEAHKLASLPSSFPSTSVPMSTTTTTTTTTTSSSSSSSIPTSTLNASQSLTSPSMTPYIDKCNASNVSHNIKNKQSNTSTFSHTNHPSDSLPCTNKDTAPLPYSSTTTTPLSPSSSSSSSSPFSYLPWQLYRPFLITYATQGQLKHILTLLTQLKQSNKIHFDQHVYHVIMSHLCQAGHLEQAYAFLLNTPSKSWLPLCNMYLKALLQQPNNFNEAERFFQSLWFQFKVTPDPITFNTMIHGYAQANRFSDAFQLLNKMPNGPNTTTFNSLFVNAAKVGDADLFQLIESKLKIHTHLKMDDIGVQAKLELLLKLHQVQEALDLILKKYQFPFTGKKKSNVSTSSSNSSSSSSQLPTKVVILLLTYFLQASEKRCQLYQVFLRALFSYFTSPTSSFTLCPKTLPLVMEFYLLPLFQFSPSSSSSSSPLDQCIQLFLRHLHLATPSAINVFLKACLMDSKGQTYHHTAKLVFMEGLNKKLPKFSSFSFTQLDSFLDLFAFAGDIESIQVCLNVLHEQQGFSETKRFKLMEILHHRHSPSLVQQVQDYLNQFHSKKGSSNFKQTPHLTRSSSSSFSSSSFSSFTEPKESIIKST